MQKKYQLNHSSAYKKFIHDRDKALEVIHNKSQAKVSDVLRGTFLHSVQAMTYFYSRLKGTNKILTLTEQTISRIFDSATIQVTQEFEQMRKRVYLLSYAGEAEALARATGKFHNVQLDPAKLNAKKKSTTLNQAPLHERIKYTMDKLKRRLLDAMHLSVIQDDDMETFQNRILRVLPAHRIVRQPRRILKPLKEASTPIGGGRSMTTGFISDDDWKDMTNDYLTDYVPENRGPENLDIQLGEGTPQYAWELEQEMTQDFVQQVRDGQVDAANQNGYTDFVWIAIIDNRTDDCCLWRDGMTSSEIELALEKKSGNDECDGAIVPPGHFNCRCTLAPVTDNIPEQPELNIGDFTAWLNQTNSP